MEDGEYNLVGVRTGEVIKEMVSWLRSSAGWLYGRTPDRKWVAAYRHHIISQVMQPSDYVLWTEERERLAQEYTPHLRELQAECGAAQVVLNTATLKKIRFENEYLAKLAATFQEPAPDKNQDRGDQ